MIDKKTILALKLQMEASIYRGFTGSMYNGIRIATLSIIQAHKLTQVQAQKVVNKVGFYISKNELKLWVKKEIKMEAEIREKMIDELTIKLIDNSRSDTFLYDLIAEGFKGYKNFTDEEIKEEYRNLM